MASGFSEFPNSDIVDAKIRDALTSKADKATTYTKTEVDEKIVGFVDGAEYDSTTKKILLKHGTTTVAEVDATSFIKDGMVSSVEVVVGNIVITFNTDAGLEPIEIPLADIFNPDNYYDKTAADAKFVAQETGKGLSTNDYTTAEKNKLAQCKTKDELDAGWWSEWTFSGTSPSSGHHWEVIWGNVIIESASGEYRLYDVPDGQTWEDSLPEITESVVSIYDTLATVVFPTAGVTATRHRVAAPVPTKTSDLTNDSGFLTQHQQLTPVYGGNGKQFSEWVVSPPEADIYWNDAQQRWEFFYEGDFAGGSSDIDATSTSSSVGGVPVSATRTENPIIGYTLGDQTKKPLAPMDDLKFAPVYEASTSYAKDALCVKGGQLYRCTTAHTSGSTWDSTKWTLTDTATELGRKYEKPSGGIPSSDMASAVQTSLGLADTAVQPAGIAGLMPMYQFAAPTFAQTAGWWTFSGTYATSGYHWECVYDGYEGKWNLYEVPDGSTWEDVSEAYDWIAEDIDGTETSLTFSLASVTATRGYVATVSPYTVATYTADSSAAAFEIAVGALPTGVTGKARDCILVIDCAATGAVAPTVTWGTHFHPRTDTATDLAIVEAGKRAVFYISEYASGEFVVGGWKETEGGSGT